MPLNAGKLQVNLDGARYPYAYSHFLNFAKIYSHFEARTTLGGGENGTDWPSRLNDDGMPVSMPTSGTWWANGGLYGEIYNGTNGSASEWDLELPPEYTGVLTSSFLTIVEVTGVSLPPNTRRWRITGGDIHLGGAFVGSYAQINITAISGPPSKGIRLYRANNGVDRAALDAGRVMNDDYEAKLGWPDNRVGNIRVMDWMNCNDAQERHSNHITTANNFSWNGQAFKGSQWAGVMTNSRHAYTTATRIPGNPSAWADGVTFCAKSPADLTFMDCTVTVGNPTVFTCAAGHAIVTGAKVQKARDFGAPISGQWDQLYALGADGLIQEWTATVISPTQFSLPFNSTGWTMPAGVTSFSMVETPTITDGTLPAKRVVGPGIGSLYPAYPQGTGFSAASHIYTYNASLDVIQYPGLFNAPPPEAFAAIALRFETKLHACFPNYCNNNYIQTWLTRYNTAMGAVADLTVQCEYGNEPWNFGFQAFGYYCCIAKKNGMAQSWLGGYAWSIDNYLRVGVAAAMGGRPYELVANAQNASPNNSFLQSGDYGTVPARYIGNMVDEVQVAPYFNFAFNYSANAVAYGTATYGSGLVSYVSILNAFKTGDKDTAFNWLKNEQISAPNKGTFSQTGDTIDSVTVFTSSWKTLCNGYGGRSGGGLKLGCYEGGQHTYNLSEITGGFPGASGITEDDIQNCYVEYRNSAQYGDVMKYYLERLLNTCGVTKPSQFTVFSSYETNSKRNYWAINRAYNWNDPVNPAWTKMMAFNKYGYIPDNPIVMTCT